MGMDGTSPPTATEVAVALLVQPFRHGLLYHAYMPLAHGHSRIVDNLALVFPGGGPDWRVTEGSHRMNTKTRQRDRSPAAGRA
jgi:hypothetical protein